MSHTDGRTASLFNAAVGGARYKNDNQEQSTNEEDIITPC